MSNLSINKNKLKLRHFLNIQHECSDYMTDEDYLFELVSALEQNEMLEETFTTTFAKRNIKNFANGEGNEPLRTHLEKLKEFVKLGYLECIEEGGTHKSRFKLKNHQWV